MLELELKAVVPDPAALRARLRQHGADGEPYFRGLLLDRRYDRGDALSRRREVLRIRVYQSSDGTVREELGWKGPTSVSPEGLKARQELECTLAKGSARPILEALGYQVNQAIDRYIEMYSVEGAAVRIEWYPDCDVLVEVEGQPEQIEQAIAISGIPRSSFTPEPLREFARRFSARSGREARLALDDPTERPAHWPETGE